MPTKLTTIKKFVRRHTPSLCTVAVYSTITLGVVAAIQHSGIKDLNNFLKEKGLYDEYFNLED